MKGIVCGLQYQAKAISNDSDTYQEEMNSFRDNLTCNNYPESITLTPRNLDQMTETKYQ